MFQLTSYTQYFLQFFANGFQILKYGSDLEFRTLCGYGSIFNVTEGHVLKFTLFTQYFLVFHFKILRYGDHAQDLKLI